MSRPTNVTLHIGPRDSFSAAEAARMREYADASPGRRFRVSAPVWGYAEDEETGRILSAVSSGAVPPDRSALYKRMQTTIERKFLVVCAVQPTQHKETT